MKIGRLAGTLLPALLAAFTTFPSAGQSVVLSNPDNASRWGIRASLDISVPGKFNGTKVYNNDVGFSLGAVYQLPLVANLYFEPGLGIFYDTFNFGKVTISDAVDSSHDRDTTPKYSQFGLRMPLTFGYRFDLWENGGVSVLTGPELSVGLSGRIHGKYLDDIDLSKDMYGKDNGFRRFNLLWGVGASIDAGGFTIGAVYDFGLLNTIRERRPANDAPLAFPCVDFHQNVARVYLGYNF